MQTTLNPHASPHEENRPNHPTPTSRRGYLTVPSLTLESGHELEGVRVAYQTWGRLDHTGKNAILICHALTGDARAWRTDDDGDDRPGWWSDLIGPGKALDPTTSFIVCSNVLGGCSGTTGPSSIETGTGRTWGPRFPAITVRDMVGLQYRLLRALGVAGLRTVIGGSLGGFQVLEWGACYPEFTGSLIPVATTAAHRPWATAFNELARRAILGDPAFRDGHYADQPSHGLALARMGALISYRHPRAYSGKFAVAEKTLEKRQIEPVISYLGYQGEKFHRRFDANTYLTLIDAMDCHDLGRGRGGLARALASLRMPVLWIAYDHDALYPLEEQRGDAAAIPDARLVQLHSVDGHDAFLIDAVRMAPHITRFLEEVAPCAI